MVGFVQQKPQSQEQYLLLFQAYQKTILENPSQLHGADICRESKPTLKAAGLPEFALSHKIVPISVTKQTV
jgi:hypothetical protein